MAQYLAFLLNDNQDFRDRASDGFGAPCGIRTHGPRIRNPVLYPSELRGRPDVKKLRRCAARAKRTSKDAISRGLALLYKSLVALRYSGWREISIWLMTKILFDRIAACWSMDLRGRRPAPCSKQSGLPMKI